MSDRKYRQRGYQDEPREPRREPQKREPAPRAPGRPLQDERGPKTPNLMASHEVFRCARCGNRLAIPVAIDARCSRCGVDLHSCIQCVSFDTSARFECSHPGLTARVAPKDARNACGFFSARTTVERQTSSPTSGSSTTTSARQAFDDLFK
ncbi:MAG TPA: hypothetical protein VL309_04585 [Vicinamibacterales bacterium]|jgi:hypothetical protein|nr:hypothetical protein [Vicinamibacterales bacterium]